MIFACVKGDLKALCYVLCTCPPIKRRGWRLGLWVPTVYDTCGKLRELISEGA